MNVNWYETPQKVFDALNVKSLPLDSQIGHWKKQIGEGGH